MIKRLIPSLLLWLLLGGTAFAATHANDTVTRPMEIDQQLKAAYEAKGEDYKPRTEHLNADGSPIYINRLILEDSPYLLQHAHNPVDWHAWGEEAFEKAKRENKPVFLSIGYSTCHWCHVMERESFENLQLAKILNEHFVAIKVDRESHPDVDEVYMTAVMLMTGHGGWPMSSFLTPEGKPFYGGTYYPPNQFGQLLSQIQQVWRDKKASVLDQADRVAEAVKTANNHKGTAKALDKTAIAAALKMMIDSFDELQGGFSGAPKFPHEPWLLLLLQQAERSNDSAALEAAEVTLDAMARGGVYDQVGGGFHRYSTDNEWLVPHFEKMLYNQAHLTRAYLYAWRLTGKEKYRRVVTQTLDYVMREMTSPNGGFYSATDADSEGEEGAFFIWTPAQIRDALAPEDADLAIDLYSITDSGNFEGKNILHLQSDLESYAEENKLDLTALQMRIDHINTVLRKVREGREHPLRDDKEVTAWNGMMITAFAQAADLLAADTYRKAAEQAGEFIWQQNRKAAGKLWRVHLDGQSSVAAAQEDYAYLSEALLYLYDLTEDKKWLQRAQEIADAMIGRFSDKQNGGFYMNEEESNFSAMGRPKDSGTDSAIPSGSSVALKSLQMLWVRTCKLGYRTHANNLIGSFATAIERHPNGYTYMLSAIDDLQQGELSARRYAAQGGIRLMGKARTLKNDKQLLTITITIPEGWHINANQPLSKNLIATEINLADSAGQWSMGPVTYPEPTLQQLAFQSDPLSVYAGVITLQAMLTPTSDPTATKTASINMTLQACSDEVCLPPETLQLHIPTLPSI
ncbi:MAG: thioredoxin domain-containing protein [Chromatiales bacterium]|nr:DUF255 domain-containing protein [Gammaproteobacteria bacterium]